MYIYTARIGNRRGGGGLPSHTRNIKKTTPYAALLQNALTIFAIAFGGRNKHLTTIDLKRRKYANKFLLLACREMAEFYVLVVLPHSSKTSVGTHAPTHMYMNTKTCTQ